MDKAVVVLTDTADAKVLDIRCLCAVSSAGLIETTAITVGRIGNNGEDA
jgi:hypothetical protein